MKLIRRLPALALGILLLGDILQAQQSAAPTSAVVPRLVNFSGKATDAQGKAISGVAGVTFSIYQGQYDGSPLWLETQNVQADSKGNYTVQLGAATPSGLPLDLFNSGEARWLGVRINGGEEQPRVLLLSVPYALKAADAETVGGLPPSAFVLAAPANVPAAASGASSPSTRQSPLTLGGGGTLDFVPLWTPDGNTLGNSVLFQSGTGSTAKIGLNTTSPATTLDVNGSQTVRGNLGLAATGTATPTSGKNSQPTTLTASAYNSSTNAAVTQNFRWQAEPTGNNTSSPSGTLNLLFASGSGTPAETGLKLSSKGVFTFASGQAFPGAGTVTSVGLSAPNSDFTVSGSPVTKTGTLALNWTIAPTNADTANAIVKRDSTGSFSANTITAGVVNAAFLGSTNTTGPAINGTSTGATAGSDGVDGVTTSATASGVAGINNSAGIGVYGTGGVGVFGTGSNFGMQTDSNVQQSRTAGGWVKAMALVDQNGVGICFNSTLAGAAATTSPCGFTVHAWGAGDYTIDFGFEVDDRFVSATGTLAAPAEPSHPFGGVANICVNGLYSSCTNTITPNQVEVSITCSTDGLNCSNTYIDDKVYLIVY